MSDQETIAQLRLDLEKVKARARRWKISAISGRLARYQLTQLRRDLEAMTANYHAAQNDLDQASEIVGELKAERDVFKALANAPLEPSIVELNANLEAMTKERDEAREKMDWLVKRCTWYAAQASALAAERARSERLKGVLRLLWEDCVYSIEIDPDTRLEVLDALSTDKQSPEPECRICGASPGHTAWCAVVIESRPEKEGEK